MNLCSEKLDLNDWEFQYLAQYCDSATAIQLARHHANPKLIRRPLGKFRSKSEIISDIKNLLENLGNFPCVKFILDNTHAFENIRDVDHDASPNDLHEENDHIIESLDHLLHLTNNPEISRKIAENDGLELLTDIFKNFETSDMLDIRVILAKVVTNMSSAHEMMPKFFHKSGWIYLLSKWQLDNDLRIQVLASTGLHNLDKFDKSLFVYQPKLYPLHPRGRINKDPDLDVIFVHGILGGIFITWRVQKNSDMDLQVAEASSSSNITNSFFQEEAFFKDEKIVQMEPTAASKILTITEQTTRNVLEALHEIAEENLSLSDVSFLLGNLTFVNTIVCHFTHISAQNDTSYTKTHSATHERSKVQFLLASRLVESGISRDQNSRTSI